MIKVQLENGNNSKSNKKGDNSPITNVNENPIRKCKWKFNLKIEIKVHLEIGKKVHENNENWGLADEKKAVCKTARQAHSQKTVRQSSINDLLQS